MQVKLKVKLVLLPQKMFFCPKHISNGAFLCCKAPLLCLLISEDLKRPEACLRLSAVFFFFFRNSALEDRSLFTNFFFFDAKMKNAKCNRSGVCNNHPTVFHVLKVVHFSTYFMVSSDSGLLMHTHFLSFACFAESSCRI